MITPSKNTRRGDDEEHLDTPIQPAALSHLLAMKLLE